MKKVSRHIFFFIIVLVFLLGLAPRLLLLDNIQKTITEQISKGLESAVAIKKMHWGWLPLPHLTLIETNITNNNYELSLPRVKIYPNWRIILGEIQKPGKILLDRPEMHIHKTAFLPGGPAEFLLPEVTIVIKNGSLEVETPEEYKDVLLTDSLKFSSIRAKLQLLPQEVAVDIQASSTFSKNISMQGIFNIPAGKYRFLLDCQEMQLHKSVRAFLQGRLLPVESTASLTGTANGQGLQNIEADLHGILPSFILKPQDRETAVICGLADLKFIKAGPLLRLEINDLEVKDPQVNLSGYIERKPSTGSSAAQPPTSDPVWTLDITGRDLDLTAMRQKILTLWSDVPVAEHVTGIVLAGKAHSASYLFSGTTAGFTNLDNMIIKADVLNAAIHVPGAKLDLTKASGPIQIRNSMLTGQGLSAQLGNTYGHNAELLLDLRKHGKKSFRLDIDLEADLADLPPILAHLVNFENFQKELGKFSEVAGKAFGTLHLGDSLDKIITRFNVKNMQLATKYERIPHAIFIDSGALEFEPGNVSWQKIKGRIGQQKITSTSGNVSWRNEDTLLHIEEMQAQLEGASLFAMLQQTELTARKISKVLSSLNGTLEVTGGSLQGQALKPESWEYDLALTTTGLTITTPLLPEPLSTKKITAVINHNEVKIQEAALHFLEQSFSLTGVLQHHHLENWYGSVEFNGPVEAKLASWTSSKGWFPEKLRPQIPCAMENLTVNWHGEKVAVKGIILQGVAGGRLPMAKIDFENSPEHLRINELTFYAPGEQGRLELDLWRLSPNSLVLSWEGFVTADTIDALFQHSSFNSGNFSGAFSLSSFVDQPEATNFDGLLKAENLHLKSSSEDPIVITNLDMKGLGSQLRISALHLIIGSEKIAGSGQIAAEKKGLALDVSLASSFLSQKSLANLLQAMQETKNIFLHGRPDPVQELQSNRAWDITGRIGFDFDSFTLSRRAPKPYGEPQTVTYTLYDVHGDLQLAPGRISRTEIFSSKLCGLDFRGSWFSDEVLGQKFELKTPPDETLLLEDVLPCLGVQQDIIEGKFSLQANLLKESSTWYGGTIRIKSSQGRILRLKTLSRIFKVVNITDLFEKPDGDTGKKGFPFSQMQIDTHIDANNLIVDRAIIRGEGLNLFARGAIHLDDYDADLTLLIAPFKTFDAIVSKVPIIGQPIMGEYGSRVSIPVAVKGPIQDLSITPLHPEAVGSAFFDLFKDAFMLPYNILNPPEKSEKEKSEAVDKK